MKKTFEDILLGMKLMSPDELSTQGSHFDYSFVDQMTHGQKFRIHFFQSLSRTTRQVRQKAPTVILASILNQDIKLEMVLARAFASRGIHAVTVDTINIKDVFTAVHRLEDLTTLIDSVNIISRSYQKAFNWMKTKSEIDMERVGAMGMSFGGLVLSYLTAMNPEIRAGIFAITGSDFQDIFTHSQEPSVQAARNRIIYNEFIRTENQPLSFQTDFKWSQYPITSEQRESFRSSLDPFVYTVPDPYRLSSHVKQDLAKRCKDKALMIFGCKDNVFTRHQNDVLWEIFGKPEREFYERSDHYSAGFLIPFVHANRYVSWMGEKFGMSPFELTSRKSEFKPSKSYYSLLRQWIKQSKETV
ncbi:MAG: acyl-CoA thioester hydrolase/BAAT C-terminal domain-containing protein [Bdellovibrionota bacterium]